MNGNHSNKAIRTRSAAVLVFAAIAAAILGLVLEPGRARAATIDLGEATGYVGDTVLVPVEISGLAGESVWSFELDFQCSVNYAQFVGISTAGSLSNGWLTSYSTMGAYGNVSAAGLTVLAGDGTLIWLRFQLGPQSGNITVYLNDAVLNEGTPETTLANGILHVTALPSLDVSPDTGVLAVGDWLEFNTSGGTAPYTYISSDPGVADFAGGNLLTANGPGFVSVTSEDSGGLSNTTTGEIEVRPFRLRVQPITGIQESTVLVPIVIDNPAGYGIVSSEFSVSWYHSRADFVSVETAGTLMESAGWSTPQILPSPGQVDLIAAGSNSLPGAGVLIYLRLLMHSSATLTLTPGLFNEEYAALPVSGVVTATALPTLGVSPYSIDLMVDDTQVFTVVGSPTPPLTWSVDNPALASIDAAGELTALADGVVQVRIEDALGAVALSGPVTICTLGLSSLGASIDASEVVAIPIKPDRYMTGMNIYSYEVSVSYNSASATFVGATCVGTAAEEWGLPIVNDEGNTVSIYHAGATPLVGCRNGLVYLTFEGAPDLTYPYSGINLTGALFNEGSPCVRINWGTACSGGSEVPLPSPSFLILENFPNPFNPQTTIRFQTEVDGPADLSVYSARGELVRRLFRGFVAGGIEQSVVWNGRDDVGRLQASGVYYGHLEAGERSEFRKMVLLK